MAAPHELLLHLHPTDYARLVEAAARSGQELAALARLAVHKEVGAILTTPRLLALAATRAELEAPWSA